MRRVANTVAELDQLQVPAVIQADLSTPGHEGFGVVYHRTSDGWSSPGIRQEYTTAEVANHTIAHWIVLFPFEETDVEVRLREQDEQLRNQKAQIEGLARQLEEVTAYLVNTVAPMVTTYRQTIRQTFQTSAATTSASQGTHLSAAAWGVNDAQ